MSEHIQTIREVLFARSQDFMRDKALAALAELQAENARLREALTELMSIVKIHSNYTDNDFAWAEITEARAALGKE